MCSCRGLGPGATVHSLKAVYLTGRCSQPGDESRAERRAVERLPPRSGSEAAAEAPAVPGARTARRASARARAPAAPARRRPRRPRAPARAPPARAGRAAGACVAPAGLRRRRACACAPCSPPACAPERLLARGTRALWARCSLQGCSAASQPPLAERAPHDTVFFACFSSWPAACGGPRRCHEGKRGPVTKPAARPPCAPARTRSGARRACTCWRRRPSGGGAPPAEAPGEAPSRPRASRLSLPGALARRRAATCRPMAGR